METQSEHRMRMENKVLDGDNRRAWGGLFCGTLVALAIIYVSWQLVDHGHPIIGTFLAATDIGSLVGTFVFSVRDRRQEREGRLSRAARVR